MIDISQTPMEGFNMKLIYAIGIFSLLLFIGGCANNDITSVVKSLPPVHQYLMDHPDSTLKITYWNSNISSKNEAQMQAQCGKELIVKPYWYVTLSDGENKLTAYVDTYGHTINCIVETKAGEIVSQKVDNTANNAKLKPTVINNNKPKTNNNVKPTAPKSNVKPVDKKVNMRLYVMSHCPYGTQAENAILPAVQKFGGNVNLDLEFIGDNKDGKLSSMHGQKEVDDDLTQVCALDQDKDKTYEFILCRNKNLNADWKTCSDKVGLDTKAIEDCVSGNKGKNLLIASFKKSSDAGATGSPTIYIGDKSYSGSRTETAFTRAFCNAFTSEKPDLCNNLPAPKTVNLIVLNDKRCKKCQTAQLVDSLKSIFPGLKVKNYDYGDKEGKALYDKLGSVMLPALLFDDSVKEADSYSQISRYLEKKGDYLNLKIGSKFDPTKEICDNYKDDTGNGLVDCEDPDCTGSLLCRKEIPKKLDLFVMADCPYGKLAVESTKKLVENFGDNMNLSVHYIANANDKGGFDSLHGPYEAEEDTRQLCIQKYYPKKFMEYDWCRSNGSVKTDDYHKCLTSDMDVSKIDTCTSGDEGHKLMADDIKIAQSLGISASPTWLANNKNKFSGIDADQVKTQFCQYNKGMSGCNNTITSQAQAPVGSCG